MQNIDESIRRMLEDGWQRIPAGYCCTNKGTVACSHDYILLKKETNLNEFLESEGHHSPTTISENMHQRRISEAGSTSPLGPPTTELTPSCGTLPALGDFNNYPSLSAVRTGNPSLLIGYDSEWDNDAEWRHILSWQFSLIHGSTLARYLIFPNRTNKRIDMMTAVGIILDDLGLKAIDERSVTRYRYARTVDADGKPVICDTDSWQEACSLDNFIYRNHAFEVGNLVRNQPDLNITDKNGIVRRSRRNEREWGWFNQYINIEQKDWIPVTICCHKGDADMSSFAHDSNYEWMMKNSTTVQGGKVTLKPFDIMPRSRSRNHVRHKYIYPVSMSLADGMCHAPAGGKSLASLGKTINVPKIDVPESYKEHMSSLLHDDPVLYADYASQDAVVVLLYLSAIYGYNSQVPVTITSAAARIGQKIIMNELNIKKRKYNDVYRGLKTVEKGLSKYADRPGFVENTKLEPVSDRAKRVQQMAADSYHGGFNACTEVGCFRSITYDDDLENAYPTAMCMVPDIDWNNPIRSEVIRRKMVKQDFLAYGSKMNPVELFVGYVRFRFPDNVKYPCIPVNDGGVPVYPRSSDGLDGVYVSGPYVYLALMLGAEIYCETGYFLNPLIDDETGKVSYSLRAVVYQLIKDRAAAKKGHGKGSLEELILKTMVNSIYGKVAQDVIQKNTWSAFKDCMEDIGCSVLTNPVSATMITGIVQAELLAAGNELDKMGYRMLSVTTDGFITDAPLDIVQNLKLFGFADVMKTARLFLTDGKDPSLWSTKHVQDDLLNWTTRGNVSLYDYDPQNPDNAVNPMHYNGSLYPGVCAHAGLRYEDERDSYDDRLHLMTDILSRNGTIKSKNKHFPSNKELIKNDSDFIVTEEERNLCQDFDMKRKPVRASFTPDFVILNGESYEIAHFETEPFETVEEFRLYRAKKKLCDVLRTIDEWKLFWLKIDSRACGAQVHVDSDWSILMSCIMRYRSGRSDIPMLSAMVPNEKGRLVPLLSVSQKCEWINKHNSSKKRFKESDWKNCNRPERQVNMLPLSVIQTKLIELQSDTSEIFNKNIVSKSLLQPTNTNQLYAQIA